ncbi:thioredoxin-related transmembrane protein 1 [Eurytemora carolleeae]|uniref:thioredoxin-related transmembrane protein 1 n=1 Tax=Eurytemora carolleeae TaxID=1294199 RepID=UPI000C772D10|nr:thioredoxin-related transmembrane protein 1 [Eurytemora carolleeae]|eukprot:XP_023348994.1 thioredoxin-related transmembrane protein 1-like [Eurytemora affinis]
MKIKLTLSLFLLLSIAEGKLQKITEDNWRDVLQGEWMVEFFAPWCPACRALQPSWDEFSGWADDLGIGIAQVDVTESPGLSGRFMVTALPTIFHVKDGVFRQYRGARDKDSFITYVEEKKWTSVEAVSDWKSPDSLQMSLVSHFFKLSMLLRNVHTTLTEDYQMPSWASYVAFAVATILLGGILGLMLVCCIDCIYPPRREPVPQTSRREDKKDSDVEEDDIPDESDEDLSQDDRSQDEGSQDEDGTQDEDGSQAEDGSPGEEEDKGEGNFREPEVKSRRRKPRKAD